MASQVETNKVVLDMEGSHSNQIELMRKIPNIKQNMKKNSQKKRGQSTKEIIAVTETDTLIVELTPVCSHNNPLTLAQLPADIRLAMITNGPQWRINKKANKIQRSRTHSMKSLQT